MPPSNRKRTSILLLLLALVLAVVGVALVAWPAPAVAQTTGLAAEQAILRDIAASPHALPGAEAALQTPGGAGDAACRLCHEDSDAVVAFPSGETLPVEVDPAVVDASAHGGELECTSCHSPARYQYPHPQVAAESLREYEIERSATCERCHQDPHLTSHPGPDAQQPVVCTDCHSAHDVITVEAWHDGQGTATCAECHAEAGVDFTDRGQLTQVIQNGLFAERRSDEYCLACHSLPDRSMTLDSGETLPLTVDEERFHDSVHGLDNPWQPLNCTDCHTDYEYPHDPVVADTRREYTLERVDTCERCHEPKFEETMDSVHREALERGVEEAAVCTDCHGAHYTPPPDEPRSRISYTCEQCHSTIFDEYAQSVHGEALLEEDNPDVAVCTDCHGVHDIGDPNLAAFRVNSPELCAECHADEALMSKYDISTDVFQTYVDDFHGTTIALFDLEDPTAGATTAVCFDCHGVHDIRSPDDPHSGIKQNLLETCQQCHPDATENFPNAWLSHYQPSLEHHPMVFLVNWFYRLIIPGTLIFMVLFISTDIYRRVRGDRPQEDADTPTPPPPAPPDGRPEELEEE
ncbi:MAG TPA: cytochrome c3 family protein [Candidatus Sulfomarinibacteraceae bacterium]|nr:cytochrome c3 family protein [Candidatus Sulfomarinibacteraceae bacterium]